ncbi:MAG: hypothetical protein QOJ02_2600 [Acidobacteriota bacterium]|jgi:hypothetical protein|nr:hypothetical protein [Acidobacteriota bacterium]
MLTTDQINYLNIGLMVVSCLGAFVFPFELFLFSYAILGPLHYFTEISWLHDRNYFTRARRARRSWLILLGVTMAVLMYGFVTSEIQGMAISPRWEIALVYLVFVTALTTTLVDSKTAKVILIGLSLIALTLFSSSAPYFILAYFLITIIHVFIFTGAFILYGALKSKSASGVLSLAVFIICAACFFLYVPEAMGHTVGDYVRNSYSSFQSLNTQLLRLFHLGTGASLSDIYESRAGLMVMRLIAFAYTYHYLNWFSKTSIIKWHEVSKRRSIFIIALWLGSLALYAYDYVAGMTALYFLSILHVLLEFPLNHQTFAGIGKEMRRWRTHEGGGSLRASS